MHYLSCDNCEEPALSISHKLYFGYKGYIDIDTAIEDLNTRYNQALERDVADGKTKRIIIKDYDPMNPSAGTIEYRDN